MAKGQNKVEYGGFSSERGLAKVMQKESGRNARDKVTNHE